MKKFLSLLLSIVIAVTSVISLPIITQAAEVKGYTAISSKEDFYNMRNKPNGKYYLTDDIVFDKSDFLYKGDYYNGGKHWLAMYSFSGVLDGCGHTISGLVGDSTIAERNCGIIKNVTIDNGEFTSGAVCNDNEDTISNVIMSNCRGDSHGLVNENNGTLIYCISKDSDGGIADYNGGTISNCVNYSHHSASGIVRENGYDSSIQCCVNYGDTGGCGIADINFGELIECANYGRVADVGVTGENDGSVSNCLNAGAVSGNCGVCYVWGSMNVVDCVNTGSVKGGNGDAGIGPNISYYLKGSAASANRKNVCLTAEEMKDEKNFPTLDFKNTWQITEEGISLQCTNQKQIGTAVYQYPSKTYYNVGEKLDVSDMLVMTFDNYGNWLITDDYTVSGFTGALGKNTVTVTAGDYSSSFDVYVRDPISNSKITLSGTKFTATGKAIKPTVKVISKSGKVLKLNTDYTLTYSANKNPGLASVTIKGKGSYTGSVKKTYYIVPMKTKGLKVATRKTTSLKLAWTKQSGVSGYVVQKYDSKKKKWKTYKTITKNTNSVTVTKLSAATTYKFRVRSYKTISGKKYYGAYSSVMTTPTSPNQVKSVKAGYIINNKKRTAYCKTTWKKQSHVSGYQLSYGSEDYNTGKTKYYKTVTVKGGSKSSYKFKVAYATGEGPDYIRVRAYKTVNGKKYYGAWSKADRTY